MQQVEQTGTILRQHHPIGTLREVMKSKPGVPTESIGEFGGLQVTLPYPLRRPKT